MMDADDQCGRAGCALRWTTEIERIDGVCAFACDEHGQELLAVTPEDQIRAVRGSWSDLPPELLNPPRAAAGSGGHRARRHARRKAERKARRRSR